MQDYEKINQKRIDKLEERANEAEKFAAGLASDIVSIKQHLMMVESIVQQNRIWQQEFRFDIGDEHLIQMAKRIDILYKEGKI